jgi:predicted Zn-dependent protease
MLSPSDSKGTAMMNIASLSRSAGRFARGATFALLGAALAFLPDPSLAQQQRSVPIVRDSEIEALVREYARPILEAAGLTRSGIEIVLVNDNSFNAFVAGRRMFIHIGALATAETPNEIIGVFAHEAGHIAGGHQERLRDQLARAQTMAVVAAILGMGAGVAGAASGADGLAQAGAGLALGGTEIARRGLLAYQRSEETTADRSAITYLERTGQSGRGMLRTFERFATGLALSGARVDPYQQSHPAPRERIQNLQELVRNSRYYDRQDPPELQLRHDMARAKIAAYTQGHGAVQRMFRDDLRGLPAAYGDAIQTYLYGNPAQALSKIDALISQRPNNPYFHELRGQALIRANRPAEAAQSFSRAVQNDRHNSGLLRVGLGQALLNVGTAEALERAVRELRAGLDAAPDFANGHEYLAQAHGMRGDVGQADLASAESNFHRGNIRDAKVFAARAQQRLPTGSPAWVRAQDIINYRQPGQ